MEQNGRYLRALKGLLKAGADLGQYHEKWIAYEIVLGKYIIVASGNGREEAKDAAKEAGFPQANVIFINKRFISAYA
jgi:hypothetical protein